MGNKTSTSRDVQCESRGRSRSFTGFASKFRKASKSPPRDRSSSLSEQRPHRKGLGSKSGQNGFVKGSHNGHIQNGIDSSSKSLPGKKKAEHTRSDTAALQRPRSRNSCEIAVTVLTGAPSQHPQDNQRLTLPQYSTSVATLESGREKTPEKKVTEEYYESPRSTASQMRQVSQDFYVEHLEEVAQRRGMATLNRDLSLSQTSLSYLSTKSKSLHSLVSIDLDEDLANIWSRDKGDCKISQQNQINIDEDALKVNSCIQKLEHYDTEPVFRPRTSSASAVEHGQRGRKYVAMGATSAALRRQFQQQGTSRVKPECDFQTSRLKSGESFQAQRTLVARALKMDDHSCDNIIEDMTVTSAYVTHPHLLPASDAFRSIPSSPPVNMQSASPVSGQLRTESPERLISLRSTDKCVRTQAMRMSPVRKPLPDIDEHEILSSSVPVVSGGYMPDVRVRLRSKDDGDIAQIIEENEYEMRERSRSFTLDLSELDKQNIGLLSRHGASVPCFGNSLDSLRSKCFQICRENDGVSSELVNGVWSYSTTSLSDLCMELPAQMGNKYIPDIEAIKNLKMDVPPVEICPSCRMPFDKGKKRKLIDSCGHSRCYTCMFTCEQCPICDTAAFVVHPPIAPHTPSGGDVPHFSQPRPKMKTNGHFTTYMQTRHESHSVVNMELGTQIIHKNFQTGIKTQEPSVAAKSRNFRYQKTSPSSPPFYKPKKNSDPKYYSSDSALGSPGASTISMATNDDLDELIELDREGPIMDISTNIDDRKDSPPPPSPDVAQNDLMMRLELLLGDRTSSEQLSPIQQSGNQTEETFTSVSSLASSDNTPDRGISDTSPMSTLTASSGSDRGIHSGYPGYGSLFPSRDPSSESMTSWMSTSTGQSLSPHTTTQRPHSITTTASGAIEDLNLFGKKRSFHRNTRATIAHPSDSRGKFTPVTPPQIHLSPIRFEVPHSEGMAIFTGREWLFKEIELALNSEPTSDQPLGMVLSGGLGAGKTAVIEQLVLFSCFGDGKGGLVEGTSIKQGHDHHLYNGVHSNATSTLNSCPPYLSASCVNLTYDSLRSLGMQVVAYHFCQAESNITCMVPEFVHSIAALLSQAPQLAAYRELLLQEPHLQTILGLNECIQDSSKSFIKGIMEPLESLKSSGKIDSDSCLILVDSLNEAEFHKPDNGHTISSFLAHHIKHFPKWLKLVVTVRSVFQEITKVLPFHRQCLDRLANNEMIVHDLQDYINYRVKTCAKIKNNIALNGRLELATQLKFCSHLQSLSKGSFLYCKLTLDLIEKGHLVLKSTNYKILPVNISEVFLLHFNMKFQSVRSFERVSPILNICLASLYPLTAEELYEIAKAGLTDSFISWKDFCQRLLMLKDLLHSRKDRTYMFFHPAFREWLIRRDDAENTKFLCDLRNGHSQMALKLSRVDAPLSPDKSIELGHHILKAHIYKSIGKQRNYSSRDMQAYWMALSADNLSIALASQRNLYSPNVKVSRLILLSGANPNMRTSFLNNSPILCVFAKEGIIDMVSLLLEFYSSVDATSDTGMSPLCYAAACGHLEIMRHLCLQNARLSHVDKSGQCAAVHAARHGHLDALAYLLQCDWSDDDQLTKVEAMQQCLVVASAMNHRQICDFLLHATGRSLDNFGLNCVDTLLGETPLTAACLHGRKEMVCGLIDQGANIHLANTKSFTPLLCSIEAGKWEIADNLFQLGSSIEQIDRHGRTPLMIAAYKGHIGVLEMLLSRAASIHQIDHEGLTALCWGCLKGHLHIIQSLLDQGSNLHHTDRCGRSPLQLAAFHGDAQVVQLLIDRGAQIEQADKNEMRAMDRAIDRRNTAVVVCFLRKGAKLGQTTWAVACGKPDVMLLLLNKLMEDGNVLYRKNRIKEASQRYSYALKKFPREGFGEDIRTFKELKLSLLLNLSRCKRKVNDCESAISLASKALELKPKCFEAYYARARAKRDNRMCSSAMEDLKEAVRLAPSNRELHRLLIRVQDECRQQARFEGGQNRQTLSEQDNQTEDLKVANAMATLPERRPEETAL